MEKKKAKTLCKKSISFLLALLLLLTAIPLSGLAAFTGPSENFEYRVVSEADKTCAITGYTGSATVLNIPSWIDGYKVTQIGSNAFLGSTFTNITIPNSVTHIGNKAFYGCNSLTNITIPNSVTSIGDYAFFCCRSLTNITIPDSVTNIGQNAFSLCSSLTNVTIPNSVTSIEPDTFSECSSLTSITIPNSVTSIGDHAFFYCQSLTNITIPNGVTNIGYTAFSNCTSLKAIHVSAENTAYSSLDGVLYNKAQTEIVVYPAGKAVGKVDLSETIPESVTRIGDYAFGSCSLCTNITIPDSVTSIGVEAFESCVALTSITIPNGVTSIEAETFVHCSSLSDVVIPNSVVRIGEWAFYDCSALTSITIPNSVTHIGKAAFNSASLTSITIPDSVTSIEQSTFAECSSLTSVMIPSSVTSIGDYAFGYCTSLTDITIPSGVTSIGDSAFIDCTSLTDIVIPDSVTSIGQYALGYLLNRDGRVQQKKNFIIYGTKGSAAETYAKENGFAFELNSMQTITDKSSGISVTVPRTNALAEDTVLQVKTLHTANDKITYDVTLISNGTPVQPAAPVTVKIPVPATMNGADCKVYRQEADGTYTDMHAVYQNGYMVFTTDHFSIYVLTVKDLTIPAVLLGDVNGDGVINTIDARWALQAASGTRTLTDEQFAAMDVNRDGKVNTVDARWILQIASGIRVL